MLINVSNHKSASWSQKQLSAATKYGNIVDIEFPAVNPRCSNEEINGLVEKYFNDIIKNETPTVMLQGEFVFTYRLTQKLKAAGILVLAACSERKTVEYVDENGHTQKKSDFEFVGFREY